MKRITSYNVTSHMQTRKEVPVIGKTKGEVYRRCLEMEKGRWERAQPGIKQITEDGWTNYMAVMRLKDERT